MTNPIPEGYPRLCASLAIDGAAAAIDFYTSVFDATERGRLPAPGGKVGHAEIAIGDSIVMLADEFPEMGFRSPQSLGGSPVAIHLYVEDVDGVVGQAVAAGAKLVKEVKDQFYGDRNGSIEDPFGHVWYVSTHKEDITPEEMEKRIAAVSGQ